MKFLSWGCGVQSTTLAAMSALGELDRLDAIITADTGWERQATYDIRDWYRTWLQERGIPVHIVSAGDIRKLGAKEHIHIPFWTSDGGPLRRQCTVKFKIIPVKRRVRELLGFHATKPPHPPAAAAQQWFGISLDEWTRAKKSRIKFITHRWPLLERRMTRQDCLAWLQDHRLPIPPRSACVCCPYRRASEWIVIRDESPNEFQASIDFDELNRHNPLAARGNSTADELFIYKSAQPLAEVDLEQDAARERQKYGAIQIPMFVCESGYCWI